MKKNLILVVKILIIILVIAWFGTVFVDYFQVRENKNPKFCINEKTKTYNDGGVYICTGLGYKIIKYDRRSISAVEFGPIFIKERNAQ